MARLTGDVLPQGRVMTYPRRGRERPSRHRRFWVVIGVIAIITRGVRRMTTDIDVVMRGDVERADEVAAGSLLRSTLDYHLDRRGASRRMLHVRPSNVLGCQAARPASTRFSLGRSNYRRARGPSCCAGCSPPTCFRAHAGRRIVVAVVVDSAVARAVLAAIGLPCTPTTFAPALNPPQTALSFDDS